MSDDEDEDDRKRVLPPPILGGLEPPNAAQPPPPTSAPLSRQDISSPDVAGPDVAGAAEGTGAQHVSGVEHGPGAQHAPTVEHGAGAQHTASPSGQELGSGTGQSQGGQSWDAPSDFVRPTPEQQAGSAHQSGASQQAQPAHSQPGQPGGAQNQLGGESGGHGVRSAQGGEQGPHAAQSSRYDGDAAGESGRAAQRSAANAERSGSRASRWRHARPRFKMAVIGGTSALVIVAAGALTLANRDEDPTAIPALATDTTVVATGSIAADPVAVTVPVTDATQATDAPATTEEPTTTTEAPTTTVEPTTTVAALPSFAGVYGVTTSEITASFDGLSQTFPASGPDAWTLTGACDGVGDCTVTAEGGSASTGASPFAGPGGVLPLVAGGAGTYTSTFDLFVDTCGTGTGVIVMTLAPGTLSGDYNFSVSGGECGSGTLSMTFSGVLSG